MPSLAGPKRPQDRVALSDAKAAFRDSLGAYVHTAGLDDGIADTFPASDPVVGEATASTTSGRPAAGSQR